MKISVVIPNWNGKNLLEAHLPAVIRACKNCEIIVVDDASTDDSTAFIERQFKEIKCIKKMSHEGFASTVNSGVANAQGEVIVLLNTDVEPAQGFLDSIVQDFNDESVFAVGFMDKSQEEAGVVLRGRGIATWERGYFIHSRGEVDGLSTAWVSGGSGAFRKSIWTTLGGMDTLYNPFYWEDIDLSYRALKGGYKILFDKRATVSHIHSTGAIAMNFSPLMVRSISYRNQLIFVWKNLSDFSIWIQHILWTPVRLVKALFQGDYPFFIGYAWAMSKIPQIIQHRAKQSKFWKKPDSSIRLN